MLRNTVLPLLPFACSGTAFALTTADNSRMQGWSVPAEPINGAKLR